MVYSAVVILVLTWLFSVTILLAAGRTRWAGLLSVAVFLCFIIPTAVVAATYEPEPGPETESNYNKADVVRIGAMVGAVLGFIPIAATALYAATQRVAQIDESRQAD